MAIIIMMGTTMIDQILLKVIPEMDIMKMIPMAEEMKEEEVAATMMMRGDIMKLIMTIVVEVLLQ